MISPRSVLITGASSGIGAALAEAYAEPGRRLSLFGRDTIRLEAVAERCRAAGAEAGVFAVDVTERTELAARMAEAVAGLPDQRLDLVLANAGVSGGTGDAAGEDKSLESATQTRRLFAINIDGTVNTVLNAVALMRQQAPIVIAGTPPWRGQIAIVSSLAGFRGFAGAPAYAASKAAMKVWGEGLRGALAREQIRLSVVCPGFVRTPMTADNPFPMPFLMDAEPAAQLIKRRLAANKARIAFPFGLYALAWLTAALPPSWLDPLIARLPAKPARRQDHHSV